MRKNFIGFLFIIAALFVVSPAHAYDNLCANIANPTARIQCWQKAPAYSGLVPAQYQARCQADQSNACFTDVLRTWWTCLPYAQSAAVAYTNTRGFNELPPDQWNPTVQKIDSGLTVGPYGPEATKTAYYPKMISAVGFSIDYFANNPADAQSYVMNVCLDDRHF